MHVWRAIASLALLAMLTLSVAADAEPSPSVIRAELTGLRNDAGQAGCVLFSSADGYPTKPEKATRQLFVAIQGKAAVCEFPDLPAGTYAIAAFHDENKNGKMDRNFVGAPSEGHGASRDAKPGFMGPPSFKDASFPYPGGPLTLPIPMHY